MKELEFTLMGSDTYAARFGETITNLGDIDDDGFSGKSVKIGYLETLHSILKVLISYFACT